MDPDLVHRPYEACGEDGEDKTGHLDNTKSKLKKKYQLEENTVEPHGEGEEKFHFDAGAGVEAGAILRVAGPTSGGNLKVAGVKGRQEHVWNNQENGNNCNS